MTKHYREAVEVVRDFIERELPNLQLVGRNGMHKYNNQDHAMLTGMMAAWNIMGGSYDLGESTPTRFIWRRVRQAMRRAAV